MAKRRLTPFGRLVSILVIAFFLLLSGSYVMRFFDMNKGARNALLNAGYHPIDVGGYSFFGCSKGDVCKTNFIAYSPDSTRIVKGCVCSGWMKGKTIRLD